jgi:hypothetical protein
VVFPPSTQIVGEEPEGRPVYAGNMLAADQFEPRELNAIRTEVKLFGSRIASLGFRGPFGLDFIRAAHDTRYYHDVNPRINGVADSLAQCTANGGVSPLRVLLLGRTAWSKTEITQLEASFDELVRHRPSWRFFLTRLLTKPWSGEEPPCPGRWQIDPTGPSAVHFGAPCELDDLKQNEALLVPTLARGQMHEIGERLFLGNLFCDQSLGSTLTGLHGSKVSTRLIDALLH